MAQPPGSEKLSQRQIDACIAAQKGPNRVSQASLAARYGVSQRIISKWTKAQIDTRGCRTRYGADTKEEARRLRVEEGLNYSEIGRRLGIECRTIGRWLGPAAHAGPRGPVYRPSKEGRLRRAAAPGGPYSLALRAEARRLWRAGGTTQRDIAKALDVSERTVGRWIRD